MSRWEYQYILWRLNISRTIGVVGIMFKMLDLHSILKFTYIKVYLYLSAGGVCIIKTLR